MKGKDVHSTRGILHAAAGRQKFALSRFEPGGPLEPFVEHYWVVQYDLRDDPPYKQTVLSYPNVNLAFEHDDRGRRALVYGIPAKPFVRELRSAGRVLGVKFRAGCFYPFLQRDVATLTGKNVAADEVFGAGFGDWTDAVLDAGEGAAMAEAAEQALRALLPERDEQGELAGSIVRLTMGDRTILKVEQLSERTGLSIRQLQRLFRKYVGVAPKWVIRRFRLQEAAERLEKDEPLDWTELAAVLGYFDQSHFIKDFKSVVGRSPVEYGKQAGINIP